MKSAIVIAAGAVAGLAAGSFSPLLFTRDAGPATDPPQALVPDGVAPSIDTQLSASLDALRAEIEELHMRIAWLEDAAVDPRQPVSPAQPLAEVSEEDLTQLVTSLNTPGKPLPENLLQGVEQAIQDVRDAERRERDAQRAEIQEERTQERLNELVSELGLTPVQTDQMREHLSQYSQKRAELYETARENGDFYGVRDSMRDLRRSSNEALGTILDPVQLERYRELDDDSRGGRGGEGRRDRDRDRESGGR